MKVRQRHQLIPSQDTDDQRKKSNWIQGTLDITQLKLFLSDTAFPLWPSPFKKLKISSDSFQGHYWSKNLEFDWKRGTPGHIQPKW